MACKYCGKERKKGVIFDAMGIDHESCRNESDDRVNNNKCLWCGENDRENGWGCNDCEANNRRYQNYPGT